MKRKTKGFSQQNNLGQRFKRVLWGVWIFLFFFNFDASLSELNAAEPEKMDRLESKLNHRVSLGDLIEYAYQQHPSIQVAREAWQATVESFRVATGYPDPELMVTYYPEPLETRLGPQDWNASISQKIPFPGKLSKAGEIVETEARIAKLDLDLSLIHI